MNSVGKNSLADIREILPIYIVMFSDKNHGCYSGNYDDLCRVSPQSFFEII